MPLRRPRTAEVRGDGIAVGSGRSHERASLEESGTRCFGMSPHGGIAAPIRSCSAVRRSLVKPTRCDRRARAQAVKLRDADWPGWPIRKAKAPLYILTRGLFRPSTREERLQTHEHDLFQAR